ncbi:tRNA synthetase class 1 family protein [Tripterygium wilfordii]|uniref:cysteine--tRNA ligase n=1 Tax=Tripterygium wilfordii TaxID=458696 RepID=A0A7J7DFZ4_TRIWF|nr:cysteine--tRNA ligase 2, cytoplasmic-like [Tripterygium wilfordii]XP_038707552.1 cysteine--tRNA ligase 2, cytoplasmic-like [Tripterygium wilfordii]KAF5745251.1 tRNA synthetase class 1 family protein [Tripterygium wilfordii]
MATREEYVFKVYNSMTQQKEVFEPKVAGKVGMYVCGVTTYDLSHLGHARAALSFDILYRYLQQLGYEVTYIRNFTDIDDKIINRAKELNEDPLALSGRFCDEYLVDMDDLQCLHPTHQPRVTEHMEQIMKMIDQIINKDCAYVVDGDVFFAVDNFPNYGQLSGQRLENNRAGERVAVDSRKRNPADFALWKAAKPGEPSWQSPWGPGRPGWHIECSAMSAYYLTHTFDIHGGGIDLIFPHHENEIAQSCAACEESNVSYWMHNGHVTNNNEKMSKSLGNFFTIRQITERYHPLALRHFLISVHYRSPLNFSVPQLESASEAVFYIYQTLQDCEDALLPFKEEFKEGAEQKGKTARANDDAQKCINKLRDEFQTKMSDDLNTSPILTGAFLDALKCINSSLNMLKKKLQKQQKSIHIQSLVQLEKEAKEVLEILGMLPPCTYAQVLMQLKDKALKRAGLVEEDISGFIEERAVARKNKDFSRSDQIRADLTVKGIALMDLGNETIWRPCVPVQQDQEQPHVAGR